VTTQTTQVDAQRMDDLVRSHLPLVGHIVRETMTRLPAHIGRDDLVSAGMYALAAAAASYDESRGVPFGRFAAIRIRGAITDELRGRDWASRSVRGKAREIEEIRNQLAATLGRTPTRDEIARAGGLEPRDIDAVEADVHRASVMSLQALTSEFGDEATPVGGEEPEALLLQREQMGYLRDALVELPERLQTVVRGYFFENRRMVDIAAELGVTESRVSQLRSEALGLLRTAMQSVGENPAGVPVSGGKARAAERAAYCAAVATRSTLADRLHATTAFGEVRTSFEADLRVAT
jgi:RNA polymerase sigma factor FliA